MSALPSAAVSRLFILGARKAPQSFLERLSDFPKLSGVTPASRLEVRPAPEMVTSGIREIDALTGGLPRGCLTEICGPASSGRTTLSPRRTRRRHSTRRSGALIDAGNTLDPHFRGRSRHRSRQIVMGALRRKKTLHRQIFPDFLRTSAPSPNRPAAPRTTASSTRFFASPICFCKVMALGSSLSTSETFPPAPPAVFRLLPGFAFAAPSKQLPPSCW